MRTTVVIIGAGPAGLAMSRCLTARAIDHVLLERGEAAHTWRTERWDSLRLLTPNWFSRLPGWHYRGDDPDGYMTAAEVVEHLDGYRRSFNAPVRPRTTVLAVRPTPSGFTVTTDHDQWRCRGVVIATGAASRPRIPALARELPTTVAQLVPIRYRNPDRIGDGRVLVVGASASGVQIADELARSGRTVTLAVGEHSRLPRTYRGRDIHWWLDAIGQLDERHDEIDDLARARRQPSLQLVGSPQRRTLDLNALSAIGVELVGRFVGITGHTARLSGSLAAVCASADLKQGRLLDRIDAFAAAATSGLAGEVGPPHRPRPTVVGPARTTLDLRSFGTVVWATGYAPRYPWLDPGRLDGKGAVRHDGGVLPEPGMYVLGLAFTRRRKSTFLDGFGPDAEELAAHLAAHLDRRVPWTGARRTAA
jgi:putative flavoprotein involved in K+ transport